MVRASRILRRFLESVVLALLGALTTLVIAAVAFRKAGMALVWYDEVASILLAWLTYYGSALAALHRGHIGLPKLVELAKPRFRVMLVVAREIIVVGFFIMTAWAGMWVLSVLGGDTLVSVPWVPTRLTQSVIPIGAVLFILAELLSFVRDRSDGP